jgi:hypothetical protein
LRVAGGHRISLRRCLSTWAWVAWGNLEATRRLLWVARHGIRSLSLRVLRCVLGNTWLRHRICCSHWLSRRVTCGASNWCVLHRWHAAGWGVVNRRLH